MNTFDKYWLRAFYVPCPNLRTRDPVEKNRSQVPVLMKHSFVWEQRDQKTQEQVNNNILGDNKAHGE